MNIRSYLRHTYISIYLVLLVILTSRFVGIAATNHLLIEAAALLPLFPILGLFWLKTKEELWGWGLFTIWLGSTYASLGSTEELSVFILISCLAITGIVYSHWFLVVAWFGHIIWDFLPRELPEILHDLPTACMIFDGLIGIYIIWRIPYIKNREFQLNTKIDH